MKLLTAVLFICSLQYSLPMEIKNSYKTIHADINIDDGSRDRRDVIEEEKFYNIRTDVKEEKLPKPWMPGPLPPDDPTTRVSLTMDGEKEQLFQTTERVTDKPTSRGARASNENWVKLPYPGRDEEERDHILTPPQPSGELVNSRMPRINFVTQNKALEASESRNSKDSIQRNSRNDDIRTEFVRPDQEQKTQKPVFPRQAVYYPEESRRAPYYPRDGYQPEDLYRRDPFLDSYDRRRYYTGLPRTDRYDEPYDNYVSRKPKRIIYYAHLPEVVRTPPSVDLRYRYSVDPYRRFDDEYSGSARSGRYDYRFRNRYPYAPLRKEDRIYRDLAGSGTSNKDKKVEQKVTASPVLPQKEGKAIEKRKQANNVINSHQYHDTMDVHFNDQLIQKSFEDVVRPDNGYLRYDEPLFEGAIDDPYRQKYF